MKRILQILTAILIITIILIIFISMAKEQKMVVIKEGNTSLTPLEIVLGKYQDSDCGMIINDLTFASQVISNDGKTWFFHDHGGMANWLNSKDFKNSAKVFVMSKDTKRYIDAKTAFFSTNEITPMRYGFGAYENNQDGFISFEEMNLRVLRKETLANPQYKEHNH
ncbi:hypothetical protein CRU87_04615 [Aliarcobacter trophiarum LMG 25534]|uniref:Uncharacterized protein n=1 Tax=Aliarcobacter trophiarum LMG 25534 TaxID=1032241 RepID=A0AAD0QJ14_9BACT|nr:hypothetical protein [Aliarcobacter trophiarum]AXK48807.1 hypothetical protein ATR_0941 [Aliarcobacter trophiarum LMG 25534]RXI25014.1 hypothetical protein CRU89_09390 [Aliarcobacter trophiarum]RXJ92127.1 hypothetical protein CRU87_04615 [Aliarcobacter trophiarum LMG 25534]